jgi:uncharacterized protein (TIGR03790 family)
MSMQWAGLFAWLSIFIAAAQGADASRVLVVYVSNSPDSIAVANAYAERRGIPREHLCPIELPNPQATTLNPEEYGQIIRDPVRTCIETIDKHHVLYIVLAYIRPFAIELDSETRYAIDSYLADPWEVTGSAPARPVPAAPHGYFADNQAQGNFFFHFLPFSEHRKQNPSQLIYSVWRLDGATPELARGLVDKAIYAETHGLSGQACIDANAEIEASPDFGYISANWDLYRAAQFLRMANITVVEDRLESEFGTAPSPAECGNTALYSGWYSLNNYNNAFQWNPGAIGFHLDSFSAGDPREGANWSANAIQRGIAVTSGAMAEPYLEGLPRPSGVFRNLLQGASVGDAFLRNTRWLRWRTLNIGDPLYRPFPQGVAPFQEPFAENAIVILPRFVTGGGRILGAVTVDRPAPRGSRTVQLSTPPDSPVQVPPEVTIPRNSVFAWFPIALDFVAGQTLAQITADTGQTTIRNTIVIFPVLSSLVNEKPSLRPGESMRALIVLNRAAPAGGYKIEVSSDHPAILKVPAEVTAPAGARSVEFQVEYPGGAAVKEDTTITISASLARGKVTATVVAKP